MRRTGIPSILLVTALLFAGAACSDGTTEDTNAGATVVDCDINDASCDPTTDLTTSPEDSIALAEDDKGVSPPEEFQIAQTLRLTDAGPVPLTLVVIQNRELTITNETAQPQTLNFVNAQVDDTGATSLGPIAPGADLVYVPPLPASMAYNLTGGTEVQARLQVDTGDFEG
jgi:hypothetical protein